MEVTYRMQDGFQVPNLLMPQMPEAHLGKYAELRRAYLKKHRRVLYTNLKTSGKLTEHLAEIEQTIKTMPNYFDDYDTTVTFITEEELKKNHSKMPHGGFVIRSGKTGVDGNNHIIEYSLKLDSNPEFTASVLACYARAAYRLAKAGESGAKTVFDIAPALLSVKTPEELRAELL